MGFFNLFKKKKQELPEETLKWNKMWDLWAEEKVESPFAELMKYESEVNNGGHDQFFINVSENEDLQKTAETLYAILPDVLKENLKNAYQIYSEMNDTDEDTYVARMDECDDVFYENEDLIIQILKEYADRIML